MSTSYSVPDVENADVLLGVPVYSLPRTLVSNLIDAANGLAFPHLRAKKGLDGETETLCMVCLRAAAGQAEIPHTRSCVVGQAIHAAWAVRAAIARQEEWEAAHPSQQIPAAISMQEREQAARRLEEVTRSPRKGSRGECWACSNKGPDKCICNCEFCTKRKAVTVHASMEADGKNPLLEEVRPVVESDESWEASAALLAPRRVVCGAARAFGNPEHPLTCDKEIGHDADPLSDHYNRAASFSWPTAAAIAEEMQAAK